MGLDLKHGNGEQYEIGKQHITGIRRGNLATVRRGAATDACGAYGFPGLAITHAGRDNPIGEIVLTSNHDRNLNIRSGSGVLLRVTASTTEDKS